MELNDEPSMQDQQEPEADLTGKELAEAQATPSIPTPLQIRIVALRSESMIALLFIDEYGKPRARCVLAKETLREFISDATSLLDTPVAPAPNPNG